MSTPCKTYEEAREALRDSALQFWDGANWQDVPPGVSVFFARDPADYRRKPAQADDHEFVVHSFLGPEHRSFISRRFETAAETTRHLMGKDMKDTLVFKRVRLQSLDVRKIEQQLENA